MPSLKVAKPTKQRRTYVVAAVVFLALAACLLCGGLAFWFSGAGTYLSDLIGGSSSGSASTLRIWGDPPTTLDPALVQDAASATYVVELYSGLVTLDQQLNVVPDLAKSWDVNADGTVYTFHLRPGALFHDGAPVTAADFKASFERACNPALGSTVAATYLGDIVGVQEAISGQQQGISGVRVIDDLTLEITIDRPKAYFLAKLTYPAAFVVKPATLLNASAGELIGTGPFTLGKVSSDAIELDANPSFYNGPAKVSRVQFVLGGGEPVSMYETGQLDIAPVSVTDIDRARDPENPLNSELVTIPSLDVQYIGFDVRMPPFDDVNVRRAFVYALDRSKLADVVLKGMVVPAPGVLPPGLPGYDPTFQGLGFDPAKAQELIKQSKYGSVDNLPPIVLNIADDVTGPSRSIQSILAMWKDNLGIDVSVEAVDWSTFLTEVNEQRYQMFSLGWVADYPDPANFLDLMFASGSAENHMGYANSQVDQLLLQASGETDETRRLQLYQQVEQIVVADAIWAPLWHDEDYYLVKPYVKGMSMASTIVPWLRQVSLEQN